MMELFKVVYASRPKHFMYTLACNPGLQNIRATVCALIDVMFLFASPENQELASYITTMCLDLLLNAVRLTPYLISYRSAEGSRNQVVTLFYFAHRIQMSGLPVSRQWSEF